MGIFSTWLKQEGLGDDSSSAFQLNRNDRGVDFEQTRNDLFKLVFDKYPDQTLEFLNSIASNGDTEIQDLLKKVDNDRPNAATRPKHPVSGEVVPPEADTGMASEGPN